MFSELEPINTGLFLSCSCCRNKALLSPWSLCAMYSTWCAQGDLPDSASGESNPSPATAANGCLFEVTHLDPLSSDLSRALRYIRHSIPPSF